MRLFVLLLAAVTGLKLWYRDETYRAAADQAVAAAYLPAASAACQKLKQTNSNGQPAMRNSWSGSGRLIACSGMRATKIRI
jgi:hypothetical protein